MTRETRLTAWVLTILILLTGADAIAQETGQPAAKRAPAVKPGGSLVYEVVEVKGKVRVGPSNLDPKLSVGWTRVKVGDRLAAGLQIEVPLRGALKLTARPSEPPTVILIKRASRVYISELSLKGGVAKSRIDLAYGAVRAGVAEGQTRSDMQIRCPVATLSKRGTDIFEIEYRNGHFMISLSEQGRGLIEAIQQRSTAFGASIVRRRERSVTAGQFMRSRSVTPGQFVQSSTRGQFITHKLVSAIDNVQMDRQVNIHDLFGLTELEQLSAMLDDHGIGLLEPWGNPVRWLDSPTVDGQIGVVPDFDPSVDGHEGDFNLPQFPAGRHHSDGDFGIGQGSLPGVFSFGAKASLAERAKAAAQRRLAERLGRKR